MDRLGALATYAAAVSVFLCEQDEQPKPDTTEARRLSDEGAALSKAFMERTAHMEHSPDCRCKRCKR